MAVFMTGIRSSLSIGLLLIAGCASRGPEIPTYRSSDSASVESRVAWTGARASDRHVDDLDGIDTAGDDPVLDAWVTRARALRMEAEERRMQDARVLMERIRSTEGGPRAGDLGTLADLRRSGLSPSLDSEAGLILEDGIQTWTDAALDAIEHDDAEAAVTALSAISMAAADGRHPRLELESRNQAGRLMDRIGITRDRTLPPRVLAYTLDRLVSVHVDRPEWRTLVDAGFTAAENACSNDGGRRTIMDIRASFDERTASLVEKPGEVPSRIRSALRMVGRRLEEASEAPQSIFGKGVDGVRIFLEGMIDTTDIRTRAYYGKDAESLERMLNDTYIGVGTELQSVPEGIILSPIAGSPSRRAGIREGDLLTEVDGVAVDDIPIGETIERILGRSGTVVELTIRREAPDGSASTLVIPVVRGEVERETLNGWRQVGHDRMGRPLWDWIIDPESGIAYIGIREFVEDTDRRFRAAIAEANRELQSVGGPDRQIEGLIIDLRDNGGGRRDSTERLLDLFLSDGDLFATEGNQSDSDDRTPASGRNTRLEGMPVVVIVDEGSASASEILAGTLQGRAGAIVLGERTFGKGSVQQVARVPDGYLVVTESWFKVPDGETGTRTIDRFKNPHRWGITPDVSSPATEEETIDFLEERGGWRSGLGQDGFNFEDLPTVETTKDRPLLDAVILLRRRLAPGDHPVVRDQ